MNTNYRLLLILIFLCVVSLIISSCKSSKSSCDAYGFHWENPNIDSLGVNKDDVTYIPFIPVYGARQFNIKYGESGRYHVMLKDGDIIVEEKSFVLR